MEMLILISAAVAAGVALSSAGGAAGGEPTPPAVEARPRTGANDWERAYGIVRQVPVYGAVVTGLVIAGKVIEDLIEGDEASYDEMVRAITPRLNSGEFDDMVWAWDRAPTSRGVGESLSDYMIKAEIIKTAARIALDSTFARGRKLTSTSMTIVRNRFMDRLEFLGGGSPAAPAAASWSTLMFGGGSR